MILVSLSISLCHHLAERWSDCQERCGNRSDCTWGSDCVPMSLSWPCGLLSARPVTDLCPARDTMLYQTLWLYLLSLLILVRRGVSSSGAPAWRMCCVSAKLGFTNSTTDNLVFWVWLPHSWWFCSWGSHRAAVNSSVSGNVKTFLVSARKRRNDVTN